jgi:hypothetical protein
MNNLVSINKRQRELEKKGKKLTAKQGRDKDKLAKLADGIFGVSRADIDQNKFGDMGKLAQYSAYGKSTRGKAYKRSKMAKNARTGKIRQREIAAEHLRRSDNKVSRGLDSSSSGGASYLGRTKTKRFAALHDAAQARAAKNGVSYQGRTVRGNSQESIDNLGVANIRGGSLGRTTAGLSKTGSLRPPKRASVDRRTQGGRGGPKKPPGPRKPRTPRKKK